MTDDAYEVRLLPVPPGERLREREADAWLAKLPSYLKLLADGLAYGTAESRVALFYLTTDLATLTAASVEVLKPGAPFVRMTRDPAGEEDPITPLARILFVKRDEPACEEETDPAREELQEELLRRSEAAATRWTPDWRRRVLEGVEAALAGREDTELREIGIGLRHAAPDDFIEALKEMFSTPSAEQS